MSWAGLERWLQREMTVTKLADYQHKYRYVNLKMADGIIEVALHYDGGPAKWSGRTPGIHDELGEVFYNIGRDTEVKAVILTGTGDTFIAEFDDFKPSKDDLSTTYWSAIYKEGKDLLTNLLEIDVPVIGAANGPAFIHAELLTLSDIVIASERASFADKAHFPGSTVPGDGVHIWWQMLLGPNRGRHFLLSGQEIGAEEAKQLGFVAEVLPHEFVLERAWQIAREITRQPRFMLQMTRIAMTQHIKRRMLDDLGYGLMLEGMGLLNRLGK